MIRFESQNPTQIESNRIGENENENENANANATENDAIKQNENTRNLAGCEDWAAHLRTDPSPYPTQGNTSVRYRRFARTRSDRAPDHSRSRGGDTEL